MIVLDTNVVSELMLSAPDERVVVWLDSHPPESVWITSVTLFELEFGIALLSKGKKRQALEKSLVLMLEEDMQGRILPIDPAAASAAARIAAESQKVGRPVDVRDTLIAGVVACRRAVLATRNLRHFAQSGVRLVDPWQSV